jgi:hypothetical protein
LSSAKLSPLQAVEFHLGNSTGNKKKMMPGSVILPPMSLPLALARIPIEPAISERFKVLDEIGARARFS